MNATNTLALKSWTNIDKSDWGPGPWQHEPDKAQWIDPATGLPCLMVRNHAGSLCGYVGVAEGHPLFGKGYDDADLSVHGGLTFADSCQESADEGHGVCHIPEPGQPDHVWWFGFDCSHCFDYSPALLPVLRRVGIRRTAALERGQTYRDLAYLTQQCADLAEQLAALDINRKPPIIP